MQASNSGSKYVLLLGYPAEWPSLAVWLLMLAWHFACSLASCFHAYVRSFLFWASDSFSLYLYSIRIVLRLCLTHIQLRSAHEGAYYYVCKKEKKRIKLGLSLISIAQSKRVPFFLFHRMENNCPFIQVLGSVHCWLHNRGGAAQIYLMSWAGQSVSGCSSSNMQQQHTKIIPLQNADDRRTIDYKTSCV